MKPTLLLTLTLAFSLDSSSARLGDNQPRHLGNTNSIQYVTYTCAGSTSNEIVIVCEPSPASTTDGSGEITASPDLYNYNLAPGAQVQMTLECPGDFNAGKYKLSHSDHISVKESFSGSNEVLTITNKAGGKYEFVQLLSYNCAVPEH